MWKKLNKIFEIFDKIDILFSELKGFVDDFERAYSDGKITSEEAVESIISLIRRIRKVFPKL